LEQDGYRFLEVSTANALDFVTDKDRSCREFATYFLIRVMKMFKYKGLPDEIPVDCLSKMLFTNGYGWFTKWKANELGDEKFYFFRGNMGDVIDAYYRPTRIIISNPGANCYEQFELGRQKGGTYYGDKGVIIRNDTLYHGLMPLILRYAYLLAENILTMRTADVFLRIIALISGQDDETVSSANAFISNIEKGKLMTVSEGSFFDGVKMQNPPSSNGSYLTQFIELQQYFLGSFFNEIGLNANFNMKRESIAKSESSLNEDSMLPLCQNMLMCRREDFSVVNELFGLNIEVDFDSSWLQNALEIAMELKNLSNPAPSFIPAEKEKENVSNDDDSSGSDSSSSSSLSSEELGGVEKSDGEKESDSEKEFESEKESEVDGDNNNEETNELVDETNELVDENEFIADVDEKIKEAAMV
jgi:Phage Connector (GP10).